MVEGDEDPGAYLMHRFEGGRVLSVLGQASGGGAWRLEDGKLYVRDIMRSIRKRMILIRA